ncbi:hypothetical protein [Lysinibacillus fusiformis]|uniref:hypothetical protein n=1 Tax=Lysinibacillus fusiformis TaxID=28031 RepID=UPI0021BE203B|nr:hypothetical protein [Lysinibacillus fusiformis]UXJ71335.1 hypothetical protein N5069_24160 [Lysinibacillus fusiformis]
MSLFGDRTFQQDVYDTLHYIIHNFKPEIYDRKEHLKFIHENIFYIINGEYENINEWIIEYAKKRNMTYSQICQQLAEMYAVIIEVDIVFKMDENNSV